MGLIERFEVWMSFIIIWVGILGVSSSGYKFYVGGKDGWVTTPSEDYTHWSHRNRFQVNDTLYFRYKKGSDSVMEVKEGDYKACNTSNPMRSLNDGDSEMVLGRSGPFFFVSGDTTNCFHGQKLAVVVMAVRHHPHRSSPSPSPSSSPSPSPSTVSPSPATSMPDLEVPAPAPVPMSARNSGSVRSAVCSLGLVFVVIISFMV